MTNLMPFVWLKFLLTVIPTTVFIVFSLIAFNMQNFVIFLVGVVITFIIIAIELPFKHLARMGIIHNLIYYYRNGERWHDQPMALAREEIKKQGFGIIALFMLDRALSHIVSRAVNLLPTIPFLKPIVYASKKYLDECIVFYAVYMPSQESLGRRATQGLMIYLRNYHRVLWQSVKYVFIGWLSNLVFFIIAGVVAISALATWNIVLVIVASVLLAAFRAFKVAWLDTKLFMNYLKVFKSFVDNQGTVNINIDNIPGINRLLSIG